MLRGKTSYLSSLLLTALGLPLLLIQPGKTQQLAVGTIQSLNLGDRACYVEITDDQGEQSTEFADFEICQQQDLIGQRVQLTYESGKIMAASCQGNPECAATETVMLIIKAEVLSER
jgi:hypothetical protein